MWITLIFWFGLMFAGAVIVRRWAPSEFESGPMGVAILGFLASAVVLSPISILCYTLHLPVFVFSAACVLLVVGALVMATRREYWRDMRSLLVGAMCVETVFVIFDMTLGGRVGAFLAGDAQVHLARIRFLLANGFSNQDPFIEVPGFFATYHTNLLHALQASCSQLTGVDYLGTWSMSWAWTKLMFAAASYYLAWTVFDNRWSAWVAGLFALFLNSTVSFTVYPNQFSANVLVPLIIAFAIQVCRQPTSVNAILKLAAGTLVLGQIHGLYAGFVCLAIGPTLAVVLGWRILKRQTHWRLTALALAALLLGTPFSLIAKYVSGPSSELRDSTTTQKISVKSETKERENAKYHTLSNGMVMHKPELTLGRRPTLALALIILGATVTLVGERRRDGLIVLSVWTTVAAILFFPPICTLAVKALGQKWVLNRISGIMGICMWVMVTGGLAFLMREQVRTWWTRAFLSLVAVLFATQVHNRAPEYTWSTYWKRANQPSDTRHAQLENLRNARKQLSGAVPSGAVVLTDGKTGRWLVTLADCHILAPDRSSPGASAHPQRRQDLATLLDPKTPWPTRKGLLDQYQITHTLVSARTRNSTAWLQGRVISQEKIAGLALVEFKTD